MRKHFLVIAAVMLLLSACGKGESNTVKIKENEAIRLNADEKYTVEVKAKKSEKVIWSSANEEIVKIDDEGTITAKGNGITTVTARTETGYDHVGVIVGGDDVYTDKNGNIVQTFDGESDITEISVSVRGGGSDDVSIKNGDIYSLSAKITPSDSEDPIVWKSSDSKVVTVSESGEIEACSKGIAKIRAYARTETTTPSRTRRTIPIVWK